jgi:hypothetical protein
MKITSPGYLGKEVNGITVTPAGLVEAQVNKVKTMGLDVISNAQNLPDIITSAVAMTISETMIQGIGQIQSAVHREISNVRSNATNQLNQAVRSVGPSALYKH